MLRPALQFVVTLLSAIALVAFTWATYGWSLSRDPPVLPLVSKCAFVAAILLYGMPTLFHDPKAEAAAQSAPRVLRLRRAALEGFHYSLLMGVMMDMPLPSAEAAIWLVVCALTWWLFSLARTVGGGAAASIPAVPVPVPTPGPVPPSRNDWHALVYPAFLWGAAALLSLVPILESTSAVLFILILALAGGLQPLSGPEGIRWPEAILRALGVAALVIGFLTAT